MADQVQIPPEMEDFPKRLKDSRDAQGLTQTQLARLAGVAQSSISRGEQGQNLTRISAAVVARLAFALGLRLEWLLLGTGPREATVRVHIDPALVAAVADELQRRESEDSSNER